MCFHLETEKKIPLVLLANNFPLAAPHPERNLLAEILLMSCQSPNQVNFMDLKNAGNGENLLLSLPFVEVHGASPAKPVALTSSGFISVSLRA